LSGGTDSTETSQQWEFMNGTVTGYYEVTNVHASAEAWNVTGNGTTNFPQFPPGRLDTLGRVF